MILCLCPNAGVDRTYEVENFGLGQYHHPRRFQVASGGKGINVARALRVLGAKVALTGFAGGIACRFIEQEMNALDCHPAFVHIAEESRVCINIIDRNSRSQTQVDEVGPLVTPSEVDTLRRRWPRMLAKANLAVFSGSLPRGVPLDLYAELTEVCREARVPVLVDARDDVLRKTLPARPDIVKHNIFEMERLMGRQLSIPDGLFDAMKEILAQGVGTVVITLGKQGSLGADLAGEAYWVTPPDVDYVGGVGSGDAFLAGFAAAMIRGRPLADRLRWATATGAANAASLGACLFEREEVQKCLMGVKVQSLTEASQPSTETPEEASIGGDDDVG
jgi:1-phosphofructokinase family hexose kinase